MRRKSFCLFIAFVLAGLIAVSVPTSASTDPVGAFLAAADSCARTVGDALLAPFVSEYSILVGAAVGQLLDEAVRAGEAGDRGAEGEAFDFASRLALIHRAQSGSEAPLELVETYRGWTSDQRAIRRRAADLEAEAAEARGAGELDRAVTLYNEARELYRKINDRRSLAVNWGSLGVTHWYRRDWEAVDESYQQALVERRAIEDRVLEGRTLNGLGSKCFQTGEYERAVEYYRQAVDVRRRTGDVQGLGTSLTYLGNVYLRLGRLVDARDRFSEAIETLGDSGTPGQMIDLLTSVANVNAEMGRLGSAVDAYRGAIDVCGTVDEPQREAYCRLNLADNLRHMNRYRDSLAELDSVAALQDRVDDPLVPIQLHRIRGLTRLRMGELDGARDDFLACVERSGEVEDPIYSIEALINLGYLYRDLGAYEQGLSCAERAQAISERTEKFRQLRDAVVLEAVLEHLRGRYGKSIADFRRALERDRIDGFEGNVIGDELSIASVLADSGRTDEARRAFGDVRGRVIESGRSDLVWTLHLGVAHTYEDEDPDSAAFHYDRAFDLIERSRLDVGGAEIRTGFFSGERRRYYEEVARYYASLRSREDGARWTARAFHTIERAKARGLLDLIETALIAESSPAEESLLDSLYLLRSESGTDAERERRLSERYIETREARIGGLMGALGAAAAIADVGAVQSALPKGTVLLEYALGDSTSLLWAVDRKGCDVFEIADRAALRQDVERLRDALGSPGPADAQLRRLSRSLYRTLVQPAQARISKARRLIIVPDGVLYDVPFEVLLTADPSDGAGWGVQPFLGRSYTTVYAPSASVYCALRGRGAQRPTGRELVALGDPDFSALREAAGAGRAGLAALPHTRDEVLAIGSRLGERDRTVLVGEAASESNLKEILKREGAPRILHLATHGLVDPVEPASSMLVLSPGGEGAEDGMLHALEILSLPLKGGLVVMSACESARGRISRGEGVVGLSRAFIAAGAGGVVASLWAVSDLSSAELMKNFYDGLLKKRPAADALRAARGVLMKDPTSAHPFFWAPFIVIGTEKTPW